MKKDNNNPPEINKIMESLKENFKKSRLPELSEKENFAVDVYIMNHNCEMLNPKIFCEKRKELIKNNLKIRQIPNEIGGRSFCICGICNDEWDITDYEEW